MDGITAEGLNSFFSRVYDAILSSIFSWHFFRLPNSGFCLQFSEEQNKKTIDSQELSERRGANTPKTRTTFAVTSLG